MSRVFKVLLIYVASTVSENARVVRKSLGKFDSKENNDLISDSAEKVSCFTSLS